jgi:hypothetical protein
VSHAQTRAVMRTVRVAEVRKVSDMADLPAKVAAASR